MRVVAREAAHARIVRVVTTTIEHPVRLKTNVVDARLARQQHRLFKTRVTRAAKRLRELVRTEATGIEDLRLIQLLFLHRHEMLLAWSMTRFAFNTRSQAIEFQLEPVNRARRVTTKTLAWFRAANRTAQRVLE